MKTSYKSIITIVLVGLLLSLLSVSIVTPVSAEGTSYIIVHALNPEGVEIASIEGMRPDSVAIYDGDILIGYGIHDKEACNTPIAISPGTHIIKVKFNGMELKQNVSLNPGETKVLTFTFARTEFNLWDKIPGSEQTSVAISGSWVGKTSLIEDVKQNNLGWYLRVHIMEPYDGGYDEKGNYIKSSGSYDAVARTKWIKETNKLEYELYTNYDISITPVPGRPPRTPYWSSLVDGLDPSYKFPLELYNPYFSEWFIQYSNHCTNLSLKIGDLELLDYQGNYIIKSVPATNTQMQIKSARIETWGEAWYPITQTGGGELNIKMASVPYDLTGTGIKCEEKPVIEIIDAKMVSPNELGIGIKVKYPESCPEESPRKVKFSATINGKYVEKIFNITEYTVIGEEWGYKPGVENIMYDINGNLKPTTPLRINLEDEKVPRFTENENFELVGVAYCEGGPQSKESKKEVKIPLPVVVLHGYIHPFGYPLPWWFGGNLIPYKSAYKGLKDFLIKEGYDNEDEWEFYNVKRYRTLWDPSDFNYTNPWQATPERIKDDLDGLLSEVWKHNYARKVNFIGHSFGGLVARYYASVKSENVSKVITVGTPHKGATLFYEVAFSMGSKEEVENKLPQWSIMRWTIPTYDCTYLRSEDGTIQYLDPKTILPGLFENTLKEVGPASGVSYYSIFSGHYDSDKKLILEEKDGWYRVIKIERGPGDGYILAESASAFGITLPISDRKKAKRVSDRKNAKHAFLLNSKEVQQKILAILSDNRTGNSSFEEGEINWSKDTIAISEIASHIVSIKPGISKAIFYLGWPGNENDLDLILHDPEGKKITPEVAAADPDIDFTMANNYKQYTITNPISGEWKIEIKAIDVLEEGEQCLMVVYSQVACIPPFTDVPCDQPFFNEIKWMKDRGISKGWPDGTYRPYEPVTRAAMAVFIIRTMFGEDFTYNATPYFTDVPPEYPFFKYIQKFKELGITRGCNEDGTMFCPESNVRREEMAVFLVRVKVGDDFIYSETPYFSDVPPNHYFFKYIQKFKELGLTTGYPDGTFRPSNLVTRDATAAFLYRAFGR